jgi:hypothetical protein
VASFTLRLLPPLLKKGKGRSRRPRFRLCRRATAPERSSGSQGIKRCRAGTEFGRVVSANPVEQAFAAGAALGRNRKKQGTRDTGSRLLPDAPIQATLAVLHAQMQVHLQTSDMNIDS